MAAPTQMPHPSTLVTADDPAARDTHDVAAATHAAVHAVHAAQGASAAAVRLERVTGPAGMRRFVAFPWRVYRGDPNWVPPLRRALADKLDTARNPFWRDAERALWIAYRGGEPVGTVAAIVDHARNRARGTKTGAFGFFECVDDVAVARALLDQARAWLRERGMTEVHGPYNPSASEEVGVLVEGHDTRPALMEGHHPAYYEKLVEACGFTRLRDSLAWLVTCPAGTTSAKDLLPAKLFTSADRARARSGVSTRPIDLTRWDSEIALAHELFNVSLATVPEFVPLSAPEFRKLADSFRSFIDPALARFVLVDGRPVGYAIALPDLNEALQHADGRLWPLGALKIWWHARRLTRATFKILVIHPDFRQRGLEAVLIADVAQAMIDRGFKEADLSLTGEENIKINMLLMGLGLRIYRRYRIYQSSV